MTASRQDQIDHVELALVPYLRGELAGDEHALVERHLESCASCREALAGFRSVVDELRAGPHEPPEIDWRRYRAELRTKLEERAPRRFALPRLLPMTVAAAIAGLALVFTLGGQGDHAAAPSDDLPVFEQTALGDRLELFRHYDVVDNLDLLEDLDVIQDLDDIAPVEQG